MTTRLRSLYLECAAATLLTATALVLTLHPLSAGEASNRIVAVGGSVTEVVFALEEQHRLVARDSTSVHPQEAHDLPDIGYIRALSPEGVLSVDPDLLLMLDGSGPQEAVDVLEKSGIAIANVPNEFTPQGIVAKIRTVGAALGVPEKANTLTQKIEADLKTAQEQAAGRNENVRVLFVLSTRGGRIMVGGADTAADGIITLAGAKNAVSEFSGYKQLSDEAILSAMPDVVLMMDREGDHSASADDLFSHPALAQTPAGKANRLLKMPGDYLLGFGPRTADAIQDLAQNLAEVRS
jgi:iron complex transport system substrate-binding protein